MALQRADGLAAKADESRFAGARDAELRTQRIRHGGKLRALLDGVLVFPPGLLGEDGELVAARQVAVVVAENDAEAAVFVFEQRDGGIVAVRAGAELAERQPLQRAEDDAQRRAVGEQGDRLAVVRAGDLLQCGEIALKHLPGIFAALGLPEVDAAVEVIELLRPQAAHLLPCVPLPRAHVYLAEGRRGVQREVLRHIDGLRRRLCAVEVGGIDGVNADALEALRERADLLRAAPVGD